MFPAARDEPGCGTRQPQSLAARLQSYGFAGVASYGLLNTAYYIIAFIFFWTRIAKVPKGNTQGMSTGNALSCNMPLANSRVSLSKHARASFRTHAFMCKLECIQLVDILEWCQNSGLGLAEAAKQFVGVMTLTWAGSQVTKVVD